MKPISEMRVIGDELGRTGMSELAIKCIEDWDGTYKGVMKLCGQLSEIKRMATCDDYWNEKVCSGIWSIEDKLYEFKKALEDK